MKIIAEICKCLNRAEDVVLATILKRSGSAPRAVGTRMLVHTDGSISGTIGGGLVEAQVLAEARGAFEERRSRLLAYHFTAKEASAAGMLCGGSVEVLVHYLPSADEELATLYRFLEEALSARRKAWLFTACDESEGSTVAVRQWAMDEAGRVAGSTKLDSKELLAITGEARAREPVWVEVDEQQILVEPVRSDDTVYIFGAGHVSQMLAPLTAWIGFQTVVLDDRADFANAARFPSADQIVVLADFAHPFEGLEVDRRCYVVIVTRGHDHDLAVLRQALKTPASYIGMIGSRRKSGLILRVLRDDGVPAGELERVHAPIGLSIGAETPEEIAVSILAELIQARAGLVE